MKPEDLTKILLNGKFGFSFNGYVLKQSDSLLRVRLWVYSVAYVHLIVIAVKLLTIDFSKVEDPSVWVYENVKWKLITCWFNLVSTIYLPMCIYCDVKELRGEADQPIVRQLNRYRFLLYTSILLPTTTFADILFWRLWVKDRELVAPEAVDQIVPFWTQHCMHTVSLVVTLLDLVLVPRKRPRSISPGLTLMAFFLSAYFVVSCDSFMKGEYLYPVLRRFSALKLIVLAVYVWVEHLFYYFGQFIVYDLLWGKNRIEKHHTL